MQFGIFDHMEQRGGALGALYEERLQMLEYADAAGFARGVPTFDRLPMTLAPLQRPHPPLWYPGNVDFAGSHRLNTVIGGPISAVKAQVERFHELIANAQADWNPGVATPMIGATRHIYVAASARLRGAISTTTK